MATVRCLVVLTLLGVHLNLRLLVWFLLTCPNHSYVVEPGKKCAASAQWALFLLNGHFLQPNLGSSVGFGGGDQCAQNLVQSRNKILLSLFFDLGEKVKANPTVPYVQHMYDTSFLRVCRHWRRGVASWTSGPRT